MDIEQLNFNSIESRKRAEIFLAQNGLLLEPLDYFVTVEEEGKILACGGYVGNVIKCIATAPEARSLQLANTVVSHLRSQLKSHSSNDIFVFTKKSNRDIFKSLAFYPVAESDDAVLMESSARGVKKFCDGLSEFRSDKKSGCIVMNANPFTWGHLYLVERALERCEVLHIIAVKEEASEFSSELRLKMICAGVDHLKNVFVHEGGDYVISKATFPSYFLKDSGVVNKNHAQLDADLFSKFVAPALNISVRFVGQEPFDPVTNNYNEALKNILPPRGVEVVELERFAFGGVPVSAKRVRTLLKEGEYEKAKALLPDSTVDILSQEGLLK